MPRHRIEHQPRHKAQRPARERARRAEFRAAPTRSPSHAKPPAEPTPADRLAELNARFWPYQRRLLTGAARGLLVSPWFAAGAGFVIAAGAFIYAPHAELNFGNAIGVTHCTQSDCETVTPQGGAPPIAAGGGTPIPAEPAATGLTFRYTVNWDDHGPFEMVLTVTGKHAIGAWQLTFVIPGATAVSVVGANWQPSGTDGGTASGTTLGASHGTQLSAAVDGHHGHDGQQNVVSVVVQGTGQPKAPTGCVFNGATCQFSAS